MGWGAGQLSSIYVDPAFPEAPRSRLLPGPPMRTGLTCALATSCPILHRGASGVQKPWSQAPDRVRLARAHSSQTLVGRRPPPPTARPFSFPFPSPLLTAGARTGPQPMRWRAAGPAPSFPPARPNRNLLQCCGEPGGRGAGGPRAAPASARRGKAGGLKS